jgi:hypothetical protein
MKTRRHTLRAGRVERGRVMFIFIAEARLKGRYASGGAVYGVAVA